jgi:hypothetical protein
MYVLRIKLVGIYLTDFAHPKLNYPPAASDKLVSVSTFINSTRCINLVGS